MALYSARMEQTLGQSLAAFISAVLGAVLAVSIGVSHRQLCILISIAAGTLLSATIFHILPEAWEAGIAPLSIGLSLLSGYLLFYFITRYVSHVCPACSASHFEHHHHEERSKFLNFFFLMAIALTIHSIMDGMAIALVPEASHNHGNHPIFLTLAIHKLPEGLALCALLLKAGHSKSKAFLLTMAFEFTTVIGWAIGIWFLRQNLSADWIDLAMVHIAGGFVYLSLHAFINEVRDHSPRLVVVFFLIGFLFLAFAR